MDVHPVIQRLAFQGKFTYECAYKAKLVERRECFI